MEERRWGRINNVVAVGAKVPGPHSAPNSVSRAARKALSKVLAGEGAPHNILVNALLPGLYRTEQWAQRHADSGSGRPFESFLIAHAKKVAVPLGRFGEPEEFAKHYLLPLF
jgi:NAD(P)-dependent dehydrogenase (short-subunit alcohol dehydrogenase family)